jgi:hypothetical protein
MFKRQPRQAWISCPAICPYENQPIVELAQRFTDLYPDAAEVFAQAGLPRDFPGEQGHPMHSCWLSLFDLCAETLTYVVTETVYFGRRNHLTEKTFKPICQQMPFVIASAAGSLEYLRRYDSRPLDLFGTKAMITSRTTSGAWKRSQPFCMISTPRRLQNWIGSIGPRCQRLSITIGIFTAAHLNACYGQSSRQC